MTYARSDEELARRIEAEILTSNPLLRASELVSTNADWYPNKCRSVTLVKRALSVHLLSKLQSLLCREFGDWRIFANLLESVDSPQTDVGCVLLLHDRAVIQLSVQQVLDGVA